MIGNLIMLMTSHPIQNFNMDFVGQGCVGTYDKTSFRSYRVLIPNINRKKNLVKEKV